MATISGFIMTMLTYLLCGFVLGWIARWISKDQGFILVIGAIIIGCIVGYFVAWKGLLETGEFGESIFVVIYYTTIFLIIILTIKKLYKVLSNRNKSILPISKGLKNRFKTTYSFTKNKKIPKYSNPSVTLNIFISYRRDETSDVTGRIYDRLVQHFGGSHIFKDVDSIPLGVDFKEYLDEVISKCKVLIAVIGKNWLNQKTPDGQIRLEDSGDFLRIEIESALNRNIPVIPVLVQDARIPNENQLPPTLRKLTYRNGIPIRSDPDFHKDVDRLITGLEKLLGKSKN